MLLVKSAKQIRRLLHVNRFGYAFDVLLASVKRMLLGKSPLPSRRRRFLLYTGGNATSFCLRRLGHRIHLPELLAHLPLTWQMRRTVDFP